MYIISTELGNNLTSECLIDPSIPEELRVFYFREVSTWHIEWETQRCRGKMDKTKTWWKTEREKKHRIRWQILKLPHANSAYYTSHLIIFWRWLFVSHCDWNCNEGKHVSAIYRVNETQEHVLHSNSHRHRCSAALSGSLICAQIALKICYSFYIQKLTRS